MLNADAKLAELRDLQEIAEDGNEVAGKVIAWFEQVSDQAGITGTHPDDPSEGLRLIADAAHTCELFWGARLLRWQIEHPGQTPTHFTFAIELEFDTIEGN